MVVVLPVKTILAITQTLFFRERIKTLSGKDTVMRIAKVLVVVAVASVVFCLSGCISEQEYQGLKDQNRIQGDTIDGLQRQLSDATVELGQLRNKLNTLQGQNAVDVDAKDAEIAALEQDIAAKTALIEKLRSEMLKGGVKLPMELSMALRDFAEGNDMVTFDEEAGVLKFKSDFLFKSGSDKVQQGATGAVKALSDIMNSEDGKTFDVVIAGYTDSDPIKYSKALHPTNWHLSVHRAIGVLDLMTANSVEAGRLSVRGFGQFRPVQPNETKEGKAANRRVEIFVVPAGQ